MKTCVLIDGYGLIQALGKLHGCQTFGDYADVFMNNVTSHLKCHTTRVATINQGSDKVKASGEKEANSEGHRYSKCSTFRGVEQLHCI